MCLFKLNYSVLVFSPLGFLCRLLMIYVFQTDGIYGQLFGILSTIRSTPCNSSLLKGLSTGFCGCASTFGTLITLASYQFVLGVRIQSKD